jgi:hypothetical protein
MLSFSFLDAEIYGISLAVSWLRLPVILGCPCSYGVTLESFHVVADETVAEGRSHARSVGETFGYTMIDVH